MTPEPLVIAHRGASGHRPEHGADAYRLALELGADAIEPDIVSSRDGVLILRHENDISSTTDVADHASFADRRTTKVIDGEKITGWFTEDFTWAELSTLRIRERLPELRPESAAHDGEGRIQRLTDLLRLLDQQAAGLRSGATTDAGHGVRPAGLVAELKHATYFESIGLPLDELFAREIADAGWTDDPRLTVESFEQTVLGRLRSRGVGGRSVYLMDAKGAAADLVARNGAAASTWIEQLEPASLAALATEVDGISVSKKLLLAEDGRADATIVENAHATGLDVFTWTLRPENAFVAKALRSGGGTGARGDWRAEFARILGTGVDGVFADFPELAVDVRERVRAAV